LVDPKINSLTQIIFPHNTNSIPSSIGKINFLRCFFSKFAKSVKPLQKIIKKGANFKWTQFEKEYFENMIDTVTVAPLLSSLYFDKELFLYTFTFEHSLVVVLTQNDGKGTEFIISFMSMGLQGDKINYPSIDKQSFAIFK
jgi:hypothetical protein